MKRLLVLSITFAITIWCTLAVLLDTYGRLRPYPNHEQVIDLDFIIVAG
jgi:hypothetical protein